MRGRLSSRCTARGQQAASTRKGLCVFSNSPFVCSSLMNSGARAVSGLDCSTHPHVQSVALPGLYLSVLLWVAQERVDGHDEGRADRH